MTERPILFNGAMVRAILDGSKTQTRRVVKGTALVWLQSGLSPEFTASAENNLCPYGKPGDRLWVRETFQRFTDDGEIIYKADPAGFDAMNDLKRDGCLEARWRPSIHMPRSASRIDLEITGVKVERLQDISEADAMAEGVKNSLHLPGGRFARENYEHLWWTIHGDDSWDANHWVWAVEFRRIKP